MITKAKKKRIGKFKQYADFRFEDTTPDGAGGSTVEWVTLFSAWVNIEPVSGSQRLHLDAINSNVNYMVQVRFQDNLKALGYNKDRPDNHLKMRYKGRVFNLHYVLSEDEENCYYEFGASEEI
jgi:SPP1 family predicted phage head-tail adaptor